jgi:HEPN domain-containing protein
MTEYSIEFAQEMSKACNGIILTGSESEEAKRAAVYVGLVACEIAIKSALEKAGKSISNIKANGHNLSKLLDDLGTCTVLIEISTGVWTRVSASRIRSIVVDSDYSDATVGKLLQAEQFGASKFPNEIRYGYTLKHFPASVIARLSEKVVAWVKIHLDDLQA